MVDAKRKPLQVNKRSCKIEGSEVKTKLIPQLKNIHAFLLFAVIYMVWFVYSIFAGFSSIFFISYFSFSIVVTNLFKDSTFLNSICAPFTFISTATSIVDMIGGTPVFFIHVIPSVIMIVLVNIRRNYDLIIMMVSCIIYTMWMFSILVFQLDLADPVYSRIPEPYDDPMILTFWIGFGTFVTSFCIWLFRSECKSPLFPWAKKTLY